MFRTDGAVLLTLTNREALALALWLFEKRPEGFLEAVPGAQTLLVLFDPARFDASALDQRPSLSEAKTRTIHLPTIYDGPDLADLGPHAAEAHAEAEHIVQFLGFSPGFAYCSGGLKVPRLKTPRVRVPAGSVAVADGYTGVYPFATPGGWRLIGRTSAVMFDPAADPPSLLQPGDKVIFEKVDALPENPAAPLVQEGEPLARIVKCAGPVSVQGGPRFGLARFGVPAGGAVDLSALAAANALVGNPPMAAAIEFALLSPSIEALQDLEVAVGGQIYKLQKGDTLPQQKIDALRGYLAIRGGLALPPPGNPPPPLAPGALLREGREGKSLTNLPRALPKPGASIRATKGPQWDWFAEPERFFETEWRLSPQSDRRGLRLEGPPLQLARPSDLPPEGTAPGAVQVPGDGQPIVLGPDRPVTGGYAKIAQVLWDDLPLLAQLRPGARFHFTRHE